jgi:hypothetical protein
MLLLPEASILAALPRVSGCAVWSSRTKSSALAAGEPVAASSFQRPSTLTWLSNSSAISCADSARSYSWMSESCPGK